LSYRDETMSSRAKSKKCAGGDSQANRAAASGSDYPHRNFATASIFRVSMRGVANRTAQRYHRANMNVLLMVSHRNCALRLVGLPC
jgi:hypothetical protein